MPHALDDPGWRRAIAERLHGLGFIPKPGDEPSLIERGLAKLRDLHGIHAPEDPAPAEALDDETAAALLWSGDTGAHLDPLPEPPSDPDEVRRLLAAAGYAVGGDADGPDGVRDAIRRFQASAGLAPDGELEAEDFVVLSASLPEDRVRSTVAFERPRPVAAVGRIGARAPYPVVAKGARGDLVAFAQHLLEHAGARLEVDGIFGARTLEAVEAFDARHGLEADERIDAQTWEALLEAMTPLRRGARGPIVRRLQRRTGELGFGPPDIDGIWGRDTQSALEAFQRAAGLDASGVLDAETAMMLFDGKGGLLPDARARRREELLARVDGGLAGQDLSLDARDRVRRVLAAAIADLGVQEVPPGSNGGPGVDDIIRGYLSASAIAKYGKPPWCALAVSHWMRAGLGAACWSDIPFGARFGSVEQIRNWGARHERISPSDAVAPTGAVFVMPRDGSGSDPATSLKQGHTGLVIADLGAMVLTIEGNSRDAVRECKRPKATLTGFVRWW